MAGKTESFWQANKFKPFLMENQIDFDEEKSICLIFFFFLFVLFLFHTKLKFGSQGHLFTPEYLHTYTAFL